jgi:hypothetical protein
MNNPVYVGPSPVRFSDMRSLDTNFPVFQKVTSQAMYDVRTT